MNPRVKHVSPNDDYTLTLIFDNDEEKVFDVKPYLSKGLFNGLKNRGVFNSVKPFLGSVQWINGLDFCPDTLYLESIKKNLQLDEIPNQGQSKPAIRDQIKPILIDYPNPFLKARS